MPKQITHQKYEHVKALTESGVSYRDACKQAEVSHYGLNLYTKRNGLTPLQKPRQKLKAQVMELLDEYIRQEITQYDIAAKVQCTQSYVSQVLNSAMAEEDVHKCKRLNPQNKYEKRCKTYEEIFEYVRENGGYAVHAAKALGIDLLYPQEMRDYAKKVGMDLEYYKMAGRRYGAWVTLPGKFVKRPPSNYYVPALCTRCGTKYDLVQLNNLASGKSKCCQKCNERNGYKRFKVRRLSDGAVYKSIRDMCSKNEFLESYQKYRLKLHNNGSLTVNQETYELVY